MNYRIKAGELMNVMRKAHTSARERNEALKLLENPPEGVNPLAQLRVFYAKNAEHNPRFMRIVNALEINV